MAGQRKDGVAPLGFAIDTAALDAAHKQALQTAQGFKDMGQAGAAAKTGLSDAAQAAGQGAGQMEAAAKAARDLAAAQQAVTDTAQKAKQAQVDLANTPKANPFVVPPHQPASFGAAPSLPGMQVSTTPAASPAALYGPSTDLYARSLEQAERNAAKLKAQIDPLAAAQEKLNRELAEYERLQRQGFLSQQDRERAEQMSQRSYMNTARRVEQDDRNNAQGISREAAYQRMNLFRQGGDIFTTASMGMDPGMIAIQQGPQVLEAIAGAGLKATPALIGATAAVTGLGVAIGTMFAMAKTNENEEILERRFTALTGSAQAAEKAMRAADEAARLGGVSEASQEGLIGGLARARLNSTADAQARFGGQVAMISQMGGVAAADFDASGYVKAFKDGRVELEELNSLLEASPALAKRLEAGLGMNVDQIKLMAAQGRLFADDFIDGINRAGAETKRQFDEMGRTSEQASTDMKRAFGSFWEEVSSASGLRSLTGGIKTAITSGFDEAATVIQADGFWAWAARAAGEVVNPATVGANAVRAGELRRNNAPEASTEMGRAFDAQMNAAANERTPQQLAEAFGAEIVGAIPNAQLGSGYRSQERQNQLVRELPGIAVTNSLHPNGGAYDFKVPGLGGSQRDINRVKDMLTRGGVEYEDVIYHNNHFHAERRPSGAPQGQTREAVLGRGNELIQSGAGTALERAKTDLEAAKTTGDANTIQEAQERVRQAQATLNNLGRTPFDRQRLSTEDRERAGSNPILQQAYSAYRSYSEQGYGDATEQDFVNLGIRGAVVGANGQIEVAEAQARAARESANVVGMGRGAQQKAQVDEQTAQFRQQNFGTLESADITAAVDRYRKALTELTTAQRDSANAQELLNAKTQAAITDAGVNAMKGGARGAAVALAEQEAREAGILRDGGSVEASRTAFNAANNRASALAGANAQDAKDRDERYMRIGGDAFSRRQFDRDEKITAAGEQTDGEQRQAELRQQFAREDLRLTKDREDADNNRVRMAERQLELSGLYGRERREAQAILEREAQLVEQGLLPAGERLSEVEANRVAMQSERLRELDREVQRSEELAAIAGNTAQAVGDGARGVFSDLFADGKVKAEDFAKTVGGVVSRIGTNIADVLLVRPLERATESMAEKAQDWLVKRFTGGKGSGMPGADNDNAAGANVAAATAVSGLAVAAGAATTALGALAASQGVNAAASAAGGGGGGNWLQTVASFAAKGIKMMAHGDMLGGVMDRPITFPMAGGMGMAFESGPEAVLPLQRGPDGRLGVAGGAGGGGGTSVQIIDQRGANAPAVESQETQGPDGKRMISLMIRGETKAAVRDGALDGAMRDTYGTARQIKRV